MGEIYNVLTGEVVDHVSEIKKLESTKPLYENVYNGYQLRAYKNYSTSNAEVRNGMRLILHENELFAISTDVSEQPDGILLGHIGTDSYIVQLGKDGKLFQLTDCTVKIPKDFDNQGILQMTNNIDSASSIVLVRYDDGAVAGFNYMTGELLDIDSERASNTNHSISLFKSGKQNASSIGNFANSYLAVEEFQNNLIESGWAQVSGKGTMNGLGLGDDSKDVTITDGDLLTDGLWNKQKAQINENVESASVQNNTTSFVENTSDGLPDSNPIDPSMMDAQRKDTTPEVEGNTNDIETQLVKIETDVVDTTEDLVTSDSTGASNENNTTESAVDSSEVDGTTMESQTDFEEITSANESIIPDSNPQTSQSGEIAANAGGENVPLEVDAKESVTYSVEETEGMQKEESVPTASKEYHEARIKDEVAEEIESSEKEVTIEENSSKIKDKTENTNEKKENKETNEKIRIEADDVTQIPEQAYVPANQNEHTVKSYVKFYDAVKQEYVLYDEEELLSAPTEELVTMNEKVERSGHMIDQHNAYQSESVNANDENRIGVALLILSLLGIGSLLTYLIMRHKKGEGTCE